MNRLRTINESLSHDAQGPAKGVYASAGAKLSVDEETKKVNFDTWADVNMWHAQLNESADRITGDKIEMLKKDLQAIMSDAEKKLQKAIEKYGFNK